jgi:hypothetical protein
MSRKSLSRKSVSGKYHKKVVRKNQREIPFFFLRLKDL